MKLHPAIGIVFALLGLVAVANSYTGHLFWWRGGYAEPWQAAIFGWSMICVGVLIFLRAKRWK
jgi:hypothetical protein